MVDSGASLGLLGPVSDGGLPQTITVGGAGLLTLAASANSFSSGTGFRLSGGSLVVPGQQSPLGGPAVGPLGRVPIALNGGTLVLTATSTSPVTFDVNQGNAITLAGGGGTILAGNPTANGNTAGVNGGSFTLAGTNGGLTIPSGATLNLGAVNGYTLAIAPALQLSNSGTISAVAGSFSLPAGNLAYSGGTFSAAGGGTLTMVSPMNTGTYAPAAAGSVILSSTYSGPLANLAPASGGTLVINNNATPGTLNVSGGVYLGTSNAFLGPVSLSFNGGTIASTTVLTGTNAVADPWTIVAGSAASFGGGNAIQLAASTSLPAGSESIHVTNPGLTVTLSGLISGPGALVRAADAAGQTNGTVIINNPLNTFSGGFTLQSLGGNIDIQGASTVLSGSTISSGPLGAGTITLGSNNNGYINLLNSSSLAATLANPVNIYDSVRIRERLRPDVGRRGDPDRDRQQLHHATLDRNKQQHHHLRRHRRQQHRLRNQSPPGQRQRRSDAERIEHLYRPDFDQLRHVDRRRQCSQRRPRCVWQRRQRADHRRQQLDGQCRRPGHQRALHDRPLDHRQ